jgi:hypothetical protein
MTSSSRSILGYAWRIFIWKLLTLVTRVTGRIWKIWEAMRPPHNVVSAYYVDPALGLRACVIERLRKSTTGKVHVKDLFSDMHDISEGFLALKFRDDDGRSCQLVTDGYVDLGLQQDVLVTVSPSCAADFESVRLRSREDPNVDLDITEVFSELAGPSREFNFWAQASDELVVQLAPFLLANDLPAEPPHYLRFAGTWGRSVDLDTFDSIDVVRSD